MSPASPSPLCYEQRAFQRSQVDSFNIALNIRSQHVLRGARISYAGL
jgi:hypothetical protein